MKSLAIFANTKPPRNRKFAQHWKMLTQGGCKLLYELTCVGQRNSLPNQERRHA